MRCPICQSDTKVFDTRPTKNGIWRRRECLNCKRRFTTVETIQEEPGPGMLKRYAIPTDELIRLNAELNIREIARQLGCSRKTIETRFKAAGHKPVRHSKRRNGAS